MKLVIRLLGICCFLTGLVVVMSYLMSPRASSARPSLTSDYEGAYPGSNSMANDSFVEIEGIPVYPTAQHLEVSTQGTVPGSGLYTYDTDSDLNDVQAFYEDELSKRGWSMTSIVEGKFGGGGSWGLEFIQISNISEVSARRYLLLGLDPIAEGQSTRVLLSFERWPNPNDVPFFPNVSEASTVWTIDKPSSAPERITTFATESKADEVVAYYKGIMIELGWRLAKYSPNQGIAFTYRRGGPESSTSSYVEVLTKSGLGSQTLVELRVSGTDLELPEVIK
jgi:hypothetical protein